MALPQATRQHNLERPPIGERLRARIRRTAPMLWWYRRRRNRMADVYVLSFPKCGRTWLRVMIGKALMLHHGIDDGDFMELGKLAERRPDIPLIRFKHDDNPHYKSPDELVTSKREYRDLPVILLVRDIRDTVVSAYFQMTRREARYRFDGTMSAFLYCPRGSVDTIIRFYNIWADQRDAPGKFLLVRYEDLHERAEAELRRVLDFIGVRDVSDETIRQAVAFSQFENMRQMERGDRLGSWRLQPGNPDDPESYKTRKGKVGGYVEYLSESEVAELNEKIRRELSPVYGY